MKLETFLAEAKRSLEEFQVLTQTPYKTLIQTEIFV